VYHVNSTFKNIFGAKKSHDIHLGGTERQSTKAHNSFLFTDSQTIITTTSSASLVAASGALRHRAHHLPPCGLKQLDVPGAHRGSIFPHRGFHAFFCFKLDISLTRSAPI
jgi:hypothetical protein